MKRCSVTFVGFFGVAMTVMVIGADGLRRLAAIMVAVGALPGRERAVQPGPALG
jgi:hypothetical protein